MNSELLLSHIGDIDPKFIEQAENKIKGPPARERKTRVFVRRFTELAACALVIAAAVIVMPLLSGGDDFDLTLSSGVKVSYVTNPPDVMKSASLVYLSEEELFADRWEQWEMVAFEGTVTKVENIEIDYGDRYKDYRAIATVEVGEVFRGNIETGTRVTVLLHSPVGGDVYKSDSGVSSQMTVGTKGIFTPMKHDETVIHEENGNKLALVELAEYGFPDGERWAFLDKPDGLLFSRDSYPSISRATTIDEIRRYVVSMTAGNGSVKTVVYNVYNVDYSNTSVKEAMDWFLQEVAPYDYSEGEHFNASYWIIDTHTLPEYPDTIIVVAHVACEWVSSDGELVSGGAGLASITFKELDGVYEYMRHELPKWDDSEISQNVKGVMTESDETWAKLITEIDKEVNKIISGLELTSADD